MKLPFLKTGYFLLYNMVEEDNIYFRNQGLHIEKKYMDEFFEQKRWCEENLESFGVLINPKTYEPEYGVGTSVDAMAFKLRWA